MSDLVLRSYIHWTEKDLDILRNSWTSPPDIGLLEKLLERPFKSIYSKALKVGITQPKHKIVSKFTVEEQREKAIKYLDLYEKYRSQNKACNILNNGKNTFKRIIFKNKDLYERYCKIRKNIEGTVICTMCKEIIDVYKYKAKNICKKCKILYQYGYRNSGVRGRLSNILSNVNSRYPDCDFDLNYLEELYNQQKGLCYYTGIEMYVNNTTGKRGFNICSIDRKDPFGGYKKGNVVLCLFGINLMKSSMSYSDFPKWCQRVIDGYKSRNESNLLLEEDPYLRYVG